MDLDNQGGMEIIARELNTRLMIDAQIVSGEAKDGEARFWTTREVRILRDLFPRGGINACLLELPGRSAGAIYQKAAQEGLRKLNRSGKARTRTYYKSSPQIDAAIARCFGGSQPKSAAIGRLVTITGRPRSWLNRRARELGLVPPRFKEGPWSERELEILRESGAVHPDTVRRRLLAEGFRRTSTAILQRRNQLRILRDLQDNGTYTATALAGIFGTTRASVARWAERGLIKGHRVKAHSTPEGRGAHDHAWWQFTHGQVRNFVIENVNLVDFHKVDKFWLVELLAGSGRGEPA